MVFHWIQQSYANLASMHADLTHDDSADFCLLSLQEEVSDISSGWVGVTSASPDLALDFSLPNL